MSADHIIQSLHYVLASSNFVELKPGAQFALDLRYASTNNFVGVNMYGKFNRAFLHKVPAAMLAKAADLLRASKPGYKLLIFDALRPRSIQRVLWENVVGTAGERYIGNPERGSMHNFGFAVDLSILDASGKELDMGAGFDDFREIAQPQLEQRFLKEGLLSAEQVNNRQLLRDTMEPVGFTQLKHEWWHFDALDRDHVRSQYQIVE